MTFLAKSTLVTGPSSVQFAELRKSCLQLSSSDCNDVKVRGQSSNEAGQGSRSEFFHKRCVEVS